MIRTIRPLASAGMVLVRAVVGRCWGRSSRVFLFTWDAGLLLTSALMGAGALLAAACLYGLRDPSGDT